MATLLDTIRSQNPAYGFTVYAVEPGGPVTLEIYDEDGQIHTFRAETEQAVLDKAFPLEDEPEEIPEPEAPVTAAPAKPGLFD